MHKSKRILSIALALLMTVSMMSVFSVAHAQTGTEFVIGDVRVQTLSDTLVRIELEGAKGFEDRLTYHVVNRDFDGAEAVLNVGDTVTTVTTDKYTVTVPNGATSLEGISIVKGNKTVWKYTTLPDASNFLPDPADTPAAYAIADNPRVVPSEWGYSVLPEGETDANDRNGWDMSNNAPDMYIFLSDGDAKLLRSDFNALTGSTELVPLKALGLWYSRYYAYSADTAIGQIQKFRQEGFPLDYFVVDTDWKASASTGYDINTTLYPDMEGFINQAQTEEHVNIVFNDHPVAYQNSNPLAQSEVVYRNTNLRKYLNMGINAWWYDRNWPNSIASPISGITSDSFGMYLYHNITQSERPDSRPMILANVDGINNGPLSSAPNLAAHRYSIQWTDDIKNTPDYLKQELENAVILGATAAIPYVSSDVGGHSGVNSPVLYTRWTQYAAFSPVFRFHSSNQDIWDRAPWLYGEDAQNTTRDYINMRYSLLPLYYSLAHENYESGMPIVRRLDFNYPVYPQAQDNTQYTLGDNILVAPIWEDGDEFTATTSRQVFIPDGRWIDVWTGTEYVGPQTITVSHSAKTSPLFVRSGTVIALADNDIDYIEQGSWQDITLDVYPSTKLAGSTVLYEDDETSVDYKNGQYRTTDITTSYDNEVVVNIGKATGTFDGDDEFSSRNWTVRVHAPESWGAITGITLDGETVTATKVEKSADALPFSANGAAPDSDVYEVTFTAALDSESELRVGFETPQDEYVPEYSDVKTDRYIEEALSPDEVTLTGSDDWAFFGSDANTRKNTNSAIIENITVNGDATYTDGLVSANWTDGDTTAVGNTAKALTLSDGSVSFSVEATQNTKYIALYVGGENATGRISVRDGSNSSARYVDVSNLYGKFAKKIVIEVSADEPADVTVTYEKIAGDGAIKLLAATADDTVKESVAVEYTSELLPLPASVDFTNDAKVIDYVHLGFDGTSVNEKAINRKNNINSLLSDPKCADSFGKVSDYASPFTYTDATPASTVTASKNAVFSYNTPIEIDVRSTSELSELKVYVGAYQATITMEVFDDAGSTVLTHSYTATSSNRKILSVKFKSEKDSTLHVRLTPSKQTATAGNIALAAYSVSTVEEPVITDTSATISVTATPDSASKTVNFDADGILDYMHLGYNGSSYAVGAVSQKANATILSVPTFSNTCGAVGNSGFNFTYTNAESNKTSGLLSANKVVYANNAGSGNSNKDYIEFSAESATAERLLTVYFGAYRASAQIDVFDSNRNVIATYTLTGSASTNYQSIFTVKYSSAEPSVIYVRITEAADFHATAGNGNVSLAGYSVKETAQVYSVLGYKDTNSVNLDSASIYDYVHLGWAGATNTSSATSQYRKDLPEDEQILSNVTGAFKATYNSQPKFDFGTVTGANTSFYVDTVGNSMQFDVKTTDRWQRLIMYVSAWNSDASIEVLDASGTVIDTKSLAYANRNDGNNNRGKYILDVKSANSETLTVKVTLLKQYNGGNVGITAYYVTDPVVSSIAVIKEADKTEYYEGDTFDPTGMKVKVNYDTGASDNIVSGFETSADLSAVGEKAVTVSYMGNTTACEVTVIHELETAEGKAPDCTNGGYSEHSACVRCDYTENKAIYSATGHSLVKIDSKAPTITEVGYKKHYKCENCDEYFEDAEGTKPIADIDAWIVGDGMLTYKVAENTETGEVYLTLEEALDNANNGDTIKLCDDIITSHVIVTPNITLDINGHKLTADYVTGFDDSNIVDNNVTEDSGLYVSKKHFVVSENNAQLPVYDSENGCYMFTSVSLDYTYYENSNYYFGPEPPELDTVEGARVNALLREGSENTGVQIIVHLDWETDDYYSTQDFTYKSNYVDEYFTMANSDGHYQNVYFYARFMGDALKQADTVTVTTIVQSDRGAQFVSAPTEFSLK